MPRTHHHTHFVRRELGVRRVLPQRAAPAQTESTERAPEGVGQMPRPTRWRRAVMVMSTLVVVCALGFFGFLSGRPLAVAAPHSVATDVVRQQPVAPWPTMPQLPLPGLGESLDPTPYATARNQPPICVPPDPGCSPAPDGVAPWTPPQQEPWIPPEQPWTPPEQEPWTPPEQEPWIPPEQPWTPPEQEPWIPPEQPWTPPEEEPWIPPEKEPWTPPEGIIPDEVPGGGGGCYPAGTHCERDIDIPPASGGDICGPNALPCDIDIPREPLDRTGGDICGPNALPCDIDIPREPLTRKGEDPCSPPCTPEIRRPEGCTDPARCTPVREIPGLPMPGPGDEFTVPGPFMLLPEVPSPSTPADVVPDAVPPPPEPGLVFTAAAVEPGDAVTLAGSGCPPEAEVLLSVDGARVGEIRADATGVFRAPLRAVGAEVGRHDVSADCGPTFAAPLDVVLVSQATGSTATAVVIVFFLLVGLSIYRRRLLTPRPGRGEGS
ncbi:hypothetical protein EEB14_40075 [Rhodococcus sp. WS4]|nr:hypothetical protein EEB14_40075 [Rhodococcus sp. WS4]